MAYLADEARLPGRAIHEERKREGGSGREKESQIEGEFVSHDHDEIGHGEIVEASSLNVREEKNERRRRMKRKRERKREGEKN